MNLRKQLGRIDAVHFGRGGYQDAMIGITFTLTGEGWGVGDFWGGWGGVRSERTQWTEDERLHELGSTVMRIDRLLADAKVESVAELKGTPVEVTFDGMLLKEWRVLKEVL